MHDCSRVLVKIGEESSAVLDTRLQLTLIKESLYEKIKQRGNKYLELPAHHLSLVSALNNKSRRVKEQIFVPVKLGNVFIDRVFLVSPQLLTLAILAVDSFTNTCAIVNFPERYALFKADGETTRQLFDVAKDDSAMIGANLASGCTERDVYLMSDFPLKTSASPPIKLTTGEQHRAVGSETRIVLANEDMGFRESHAKCSDAILHCNEMIRFADPASP